LTSGPLEQTGLRVELVRLARKMLQSGLVRGTSGNLSGRVSQCGPFLVTPSGVDYDSMRPDQLVEVDSAGKARPGNLKPSVDTPIHLAI
jgi:ribulose-5-phosphate 4-epimerase/fuculose-1-phosphate aldolase